jgi:hypothetical protein
MYTHIYLSIYQETKLCVGGSEEANEREREREKELRRKKNWESSAYEMKMEEMVKRSWKILRLHLFIDQRSFFFYSFLPNKMKTGLGEFLDSCCHPCAKNLLLGDGIIIGRRNKKNLPQLLTRSLLTFMQ